MTEPTARPFDPTKPWATGEQSSQRIAKLVAVVAGIQFFLNGAQQIASGVPMLLIWWSAGLFVVVVTLRIERYFAKRRRLTRDG